MSEIIRRGYTQSRNLTTIRKSSFIHTFITTSTTYLLKIIFKDCWWVVMHYIMDIGNIHTHTKGFCRTKYVYALVFWHMIFFCVFKLTIDIASLG